MTQLGDVRLPHSVHGSVRRRRVVEQLMSCHQRGLSGYRRGRCHHYASQMLVPWGGYAYRSRGVATRTSRSAHREEGSGLSLSLLLLVRGVRGDCHGADVHHGDEAGTPRTTGKPPPLPSAPNIEVVFRHFHRHCYKSSLLWFLVWRGLRLLEF
jgi:hypothetical protein